MNKKCFSLKSLFIVQLGMFLCNSNVQAQESWSAAFQSGLEWIGYGTQSSGQPPKDCPCNKQEKEEASSKWFEFITFLKNTQAKCDALALSEGFSKKSGNGPLVPNIPETDLSAFARGGVPYCKADNSSLSAGLYSGLESLGACMGGGPYGFFVDGMWGDAEFLWDVGSFLAKEGTRAAVGALPYGDYILEQFGAKSHQQMMSEGAEKFLETYQAATQYLSTEDGKRTLSKAYCYGIDPTFKQNYELYLSQKIFQEMVNRYPHLTQEIRETPCSEFYGFACQIGGMLGYELVSDSLFELAAGGLVVGGVVSAGSTSVAGGTLGVAALGKSLLKFLKKSTDFFLASLDYLRKLLPEDLFSSLFKYLSGKVPRETMDLITGLSSKAKTGGMRFIETRKTIPPLPSGHLPSGLLEGGSRVSSLVRGEKLGGNIEGAYALTNGRKVYGTNFNLVEKKFKGGEEEIRLKLKALIEASNNGEGPQLIDYQIVTHSDGSLTLRTVSEDVTDISSRSGILQVARGDDAASLASVGKNLGLTDFEEMQLKQQIVIDALKIQMRHEDGHPLNYFTRIHQTPNGPKAETLAIDLEEGLLCLDDVCTMHKVMDAPGRIRFSPERATGASAQYNFYFNLDRLCKGLKLLPSQCQEVITPEVILGL